MDEALLTWVIAAYSIAFGSLMLIAGRLGDVLGFRNVFIFGLVNLCPFLSVGLAYP